MFEAEVFRLRGELAEAKLLLARAQGHIEGTESALERSLNMKRSAATVELLVEIQEFRGRELKRAIDHFNATAMVKTDA